MNNIKIRCNCRLLDMFVLRYLCLSLSLSLSLYIFFISACYWNVLIQYKFKRIALFYPPVLTMIMINSLLHKTIHRKFRHRNNHMLVV